ncbi:MAG: galactokinase [bacterium]|nr:galactokinase [bacterium]
MSPHEIVRNTFIERYGTNPSVIVRAPGRVNLIGEHTDYNEGFVMPMAIEYAIWIALRPRQDREVHVQALDFNTDIQLDLDNLSKAPTSPAEYIKGMAWALTDAGYTLNGWEGVMKGDIPIGAGLSSSAALELVIARAFAEVSDFDWNPNQMAVLAQKAENEWVGVQCGIMDQMISANGKADHALLIDCRSLETRLAPLPPNTRIVILDTMTRRELVDSLYNERRQQCETAAKLLGVRALRDVSSAELKANAKKLDATILKRATHIVSENERTLEAVDAMLAGDAKRLGNLMYQSHMSLRDYFEVTKMPHRIDALDIMVQRARRHPACLGARMTGGGFGGCAVALVSDDAVDDFCRAVSDMYIEQTHITPNIYVCSAVNGAGWAERFVS